MDDEKLNLESEKIANLMVHDDLSLDEQDVAIFSISKFSFSSSMIMN